MDLSFQISWLATIAWKHRWVILVILAIVSGGTFWSYRKAPRIYTCSFDIQYDLVSLPTRLGPVAEALGLNSNNEDIQTQMYVVKSHELVKMAVEGKRDETGKRLYGLPFVPAGASPAEKFALEERIIGSTSARRLGDSYICEVQVTWDSGEECWQVARALLDAYRDYDVSARTEKDKKTKTLLDDYAARLQSDIDGIRGRLTEAGRLDELDKEVEARRAEVGKLDQELDEQVQKLASERDEMAATYRGDWPGLKEVAQRIDDLSRLKAVAGQEELDRYLHALETPSDGESAAGLRARSAALQPFVEKARRKVQAEKSIADTLARRKELAAALTQKLGASQTQRELAKLLEQDEQLRANIQTEERNIDLSVLRVSSRFTPLREPALPSAPVSPEGERYAWAGVVVFLALSCGAAYLLETIDPSLHTIEDIHHYTKLEVVAVIPNLPRDKAAAEGVGVLTFSREVPHPAADAYRIGRTNLLAALDQAPPGKCRILVTSSEPQEGKSTSVCNLACAFAESGSRTLLMSCNLRRPTMEKVFDVRSSPGVLDVLSGDTAWADTVVQALFPSLHLMPTGEVGPESFLLLNSPKLQGLLDAVSEAYDVVLIDSPPSLLATDALILAPQVDGVVVVYSVEETSKRSLLRTVGLLSRGKGKILGIVANHRSTPARGGHYAYYSYTSRFAAAGKGKAQ